MRFHFSCSTGFMIDAGATFDKTAIELAMSVADQHLSRCPYCSHKLVPLTNRPDVV